MFSPVVIGRDYFDNGFSTVIWQPLYSSLLNYCSIESFTFFLAFVAVFLHKLLVKFGDSVKHEGYFFFGG